LGGAVGFTLAQQAAYFGSAALVVEAFGAEAFGAYGQALAMAGLLASAGTARLELAGQLDADDVRARALGRLANRLALVLGLLGLLLASLAWAVFDGPLWPLAGAAALTPLAFVQVCASLAVRDGRTVAAAAWRAIPPVAMLLLQGLAALWSSPGLVLASLPLGALLGAVVVARASRPTSSVPAPTSIMPTGLLNAQRHFVRTELPAFLLNAVSLQGQVLLVGALAGDADAGRFALAQRIAFAPTSLFGPALTDWLRARTITAAPGRELQRRVGRALLAIALVSITVHLVLGVAMPWISAWVFPAQGPLLAPLAAWLLVVGSLRMVTSPITFALPLRGWHGRNLAGQVALFVSATGATVIGLGLGGLPLVVVLYTGASMLVYPLYLVWSWMAFGAAPRPRP
jgi:O-antigen/teichoic acid export membrane protein